MVDNSRVVLEDGIEYIVVDKIKFGNSSFVYLFNSNNDTDICVRKEIYEDGKCILTGLSNKDEVDNALKLYIEKNKDEE